MLCATAILIEAALLHAAKPTVSAAMPIAGNEKIQGSFASLRMTASGEGRLYGFSTPIHTPS